MTENTDNRNLSHFPEDRDAPDPLQKRSFVSEFYSKHKNPFDIMIFILISAMTLTTVSLSIYIVISKYL